MAPAALALDIDGTIDTADRRQLQRLLSAAKRLKVPRYINTARSIGYCRDPDSLTRRIASKSKHHCLVSHDVPHSKVHNMEKIQSHAKVTDPACCLLIDDRPENIHAVNRNGFTGIKVHESTGIQRETVDEAIETMRICAANPSARGSGQPSVDACARRRRLRLWLLLVIAILFVMYFMLL